jgi:RHS repeat-associated protein
VQRASQRAGCGAAGLGRRGTGVSPRQSSIERPAPNGYSWTYDDNGNTTSETISSVGTTSYTWDYENRLTQVALPNGGGTVSFKYDPFGRRIEKISPSSGTTIYAYDGDNIVEQMDGTGTATARYTQGLGIDEPLEVQIGRGSYYYHADALGSITELTKSNGTAVNTYTYAAFGGDSPANTETVANPFHFTGREYDPETKLYYYRARYYDPLWGRFLSEDPVGFAAGPNFYEYVLNSPTGMRDPLGMQGVLGENPTPKMTGNDLKVFNNALKYAKERACKNEKCDGALQDYGIKSLAALVNQMTANVNVFNGKGSTYPYGPNQTVGQFLAKGTAGAVAFTDVELTFLGGYFWNPSSTGFMTQQQALILLHEAVHEFGHEGDPRFGGSRKLSEAIAAKCFPVLNALHLLGNLTY